MTRGTDSSYLRGLGVFGELPAAALQAVKRLEKLRTTKYLDALKVKVSSNATSIIRSPPPYFGSTARVGKIHSFIKEGKRSAAVRSILGQGLLQ